MLFAIFGLVIISLLVFLLLLLRRKIDHSSRAITYMAGRTIPSGLQDEQSGENVLKAYAASLRRGTMSALSGRLIDTKNKESASDPLMLSIFVEDQNVNIGRRNIHLIKQGNTYTVGGEKSDFLIFLVPLPPHIGEIHYDGANCTFIPKKPEFFPDIGSEPVPDCIGKTIRVISERKYELTFRFEQFEDPLISLNRLLNSIDVPQRREPLL